MVKILKFIGKFIAIHKLYFNDTRPVAGGGGAAGQCPQQEIKLKSCLTCKQKFALANFNHYITEATNDPVLL